MSSRPMYAACAGQQRRAGFAVRARGTFGVSGCSQRAPSSAVQPEVPAMLPRRQHQQCQQCFPDSNCRSASNAFQTAMLAIPAMPSRKRCQQCRPRNPQCECPSNAFLAATPRVWGPWPCLPGSNAQCVWGP
eukprot:366031-Chlamydomonas_euryale.AAC.24